MEKIKNVELSKKEVIALLNSTSGPPYNQLYHPLAAKHGMYIGGMFDRWLWYVDQLDTIENLWELYQMCKDPFNNGELSDGKA